MSVAARTLCLVLVALVALAGVSLDLCACSAGDHGLLCASEGDAHAPAAAPAAAVEHGCCGGGAGASGATIGATDCACPVVAFEAPPSGPDASTSPAALDVVQVGPAEPVGDDLALATPTGAAAHARAPPRSPPLRRHLALHVLRL